ncbi:intermembrane phospholipid transport protein YdbH family protein [Novosphingobium sp. Leaf2]|uniref:intermembrane phospholipid transport protein YdbH family protein n=1 Tax=Novosphingobium sp. Leaf2 TaxID=1735670 RepID=UPI0007019F05|nr:YdbH domain-containing protein [Novosphingobium sp. Leaf2]KQM19092.1 C4-dicarboxylate ABC transporter [Novosphingobium sp. Leaf2]
MSQEQDLFPETRGAATGTIPRRRRWRWPVVAVLALLVAALVALWLARVDIAEDVIAGQLEAQGLKGRYEIVSIGPAEQVIRNLSIGDPARPDLTVQEVRVATRLSWGWPGIGRITLVKPRLYGTYNGGVVSFGSLDKALFSGKGGPFQMPDLDLAIEDGRALIDSDHGRVGVKLEGTGALRGGFSGHLAAVAPTVQAGGCQTGRTTIYAALTTASARPRFTGPVRMMDLSCPARGFALAQAGVQIDATLDEALDGAAGTLGFRAAGARYGAQRLAAASGSTRFTYRKQALNATYRIAGEKLTSPQARIDHIVFDGRARSSQGFAHLDVEGDLSGKGIGIGSTVDRALASAEKAGVGTLAAPIASRIRQALALEMQGSTLDASLIARTTPDGFSVVMPRGSLRGGSGEALVALSRVQALLGKGPPRVTGNFSTGGKDLPQVWGRMETGADRHLALRVSMADYRAGDASIGVPRLALIQDRQGALGFTGQVLLSGALPGGAGRNVLIPLDGRWAADDTLAVWAKCTPVSFDALRFSSLTIDRRTLTICPARGGAILQGRPYALHIAAGAPSLDVSGRLGQTPIRVSSGPLGFALGGSQPGVLKAGGVKVALGPERTASHFTLSRIDARLGRDIAGTFQDADVRLAAVPLDILQAAGQWRYAGGVASIADAHFTLADRQPVPRFQPLVARDATLRLVANRITAQALLREPTSDRAIVNADILHDLSSAAGHADLTVSAIAFDDKLQPAALSSLVLGVVSDLKGAVRGTGRIEWDARGVTSHGRFASDGLDFAAAFGPLKGLSGEIVFTDLLGMVTAPRQRVHIASINPGIEVTDGTLTYQLEPGYELQIAGAKWPFMEGTLTLDPARMRIGVAETRHYTLRVAGLNAATFVQRLQTANISATGIFDGVVPMVFDQNGGRIEAGYLASRDPGGSVSYVGELTYKDLSAMGNFAFDALKSLNYKHMEIALNGSLSGEILTRIAFDGLSQGKGASRNFITRQIARLPIRFIVNIKAPFFGLFGSVRSLYDPSYVTDPRVLGLLDAQGQRTPNLPDVMVNPAPPPSTDIQPPVSEKVP